ncbi:MAG: hypothetical protein M1839_009572 [Geoglossum umbratile]|nr:MAG: hypothetical protein M1839_009572 [Geoglossum umbratile]
MAEFSQAFLRTFPPQRLTPSHSDPFLSDHSTAVPPHPRQRHAGTSATAGQQPTRVVCEASYPGSGKYSDQIRGAQVSKLGNILQCTLNVIVSGPKEDGISSGYWDVECELKRFEESLTTLARRTADSITLAQLRLGKQEGEHAEEVGGKGLLRKAEDGQRGECGSQNGIGHKLEAPDNKHSRKSKILSLWIGNHSGTIDGLLCAADKVMEDQVNEQVEERVMNLLQLEDVVLNRDTCRGIFQEGMRYLSDMMLGKWNDFLPEIDENTQPKSEDIQGAVLKMARWAMFKGYRMGDEVFKDKAQVHGVIQSHFARGYIRGQESLTTKAETLNMEPWFLHGIEVAGQGTDMTMPSHWAKVKVTPKYWDSVSLGRLHPWGDRGTYKPSVPDDSGFYSDDPTYVSDTESKMRHDGIHEDDYITRAFPLPKVIRLPFLGWSPISPSTYQSWSARSILQPTSANRRLMYERKDLDISRLKELVALRKRWQAQDLMYLRRYRRYVVSDPEARERGWMDGRDVSFLPAQRPPVVERVERPPAVSEPCHGALDTVTEHTELSGEGHVEEPEREPQQPTATDNFSQRPPSIPTTPKIGPQSTATTDSPTIWPSTPIRPKLDPQPPTATNSPAPSTIDLFEELPQEDPPNGPILTQIEELLSNLMASTTSPPATEDENENSKSKQKFTLSSLLDFDSQLSTKNSEYRLSASPPPLSMRARSGEKPLPLLPSILDRGHGDTSRPIEEEHHRKEPGNEDLPPIPPLDPTSPLSTMRSSLYILRNSLPYRRSSREALEAYSEAVWDMYGVQRVDALCDSDGSNCGGDGEEGSGGKKRNRSDVLAAKAVRGRPANAHSVNTDKAGGPRSATTHDADQSVYSRDEDEKEVARRVGVGAEDSQEGLHRRWTSFKRVGSPTRKGKSVRSGFKGIFRGREVRGLDG